MARGATRDNPDVRQYLNKEGLMALEREFGDLPTNLFDTPIHIAGLVIPVVIAVVGWLVLELRRRHGDGRGTRSE